MNDNRFTYSSMRFLVSSHMENTNCNLCGSQESATLYADLPDLLLNRPGVTTTLVTCRNCGLIYQNPRPLPMDMVHNYPKAYHAGSGKSKTWFQKQTIDYGIRKRCRFVTRYVNTGRILDVGCSNGSFLLGMKSEGGWETYGVEPGEDAADAARQAGLNVMTCSFEDVEFPEQYFDVISMWDVLEHVYDPKTLLKKVARLLRPGGFFVVRVPNADSWSAKLFGRWWSGLDAPRHLFIFSPATLQQYLECAGFQVINNNCHFGTYMATLTSVRFWLSGLNISQRSQDLLMRILYHPITRGLMAPVAFAGGVGLIGPSIVTVARTRV